MLILNVKKKEAWDSVNNVFVTVEAQTICLEHSLVSLSKWETKFKKPYLRKTDEKTNEEILYYIKCMTITQHVKDEVYKTLDSEELKTINDYISDPMTATWFSDNTAKTGNHRSSGKISREQITSELIYYWMFSYQIPITCEKWHLNRLLTLIRIFSIKNSEQSGKGNKMSKHDIMAQNRALNAARRKRLGSAG